MNQNRLLQDYFGRRPYPGTGVLEDYMQPAPQYAGPAMPPQRLGLSPQAEMGVSRYMNLDGGRGFSRANAERLYAQELEMQALQEQEQAMLDARAAEQAVTKVNPTSPQYSQQLSGILNRYGQAAVPALKGILPLQEVLRRAAQPEEVKDPYLNRITDPRAFQSYRQRRTSGMAPEQAWAQTLVETEEDDLMTQALQAGIPLADLQGMRQNGRLDKYKLLEATSAAKRNKPKELKAPRSLELKALESAKDRVEGSIIDPTDEARESYIVENNLDRLKKESWDAATKALTTPDPEAIAEFEGYLLDLQEGGYRVPDKYQKLAAKLGISVGQSAPTKPVPQKGVDPFSGSAGPTQFLSEGTPQGKSFVTETPSERPEKEGVSAFSPIAQKLSQDDADIWRALFSPEPESEIPASKDDIKQAAQDREELVKSLLEKVGLKDTKENRKDLNSALRARLANPSEKDYSSLWR